MSFRKIRILFICLASSFLMLPATAIAGSESGLYIGFGAGDTSLEDNNGDLFDLEDSGYKVMGGYNFGLVPLIDIAVEVAYVDFGKFGDIAVGPPDFAPGTLALEVTGLSAFGLVGMSFGPIGIFAKAGAISWETDATVTTTGNSSTVTLSGTDPGYGVGARFAIGSFAVRAEYEVFDLGDTDLDMVSISGIYTF